MATGPLLAHKPVNRGALQQLHVVRESVEWLLWKGDAACRIWTEGNSISCQSGSAACGLRIEPRTFKTASVLILVTDCLHSQRRAAMSPSVCRFLSSYFNSSFRTLPCSQQTRGPMLQRADCSPAGLYCVDTHWERLPTVLLVFAY
jgi:hypothetical protein